MSPQEKADVVIAFQRGERASDIAKRVGLTHERIRQILNIVLGFDEHKRIAGAHRLARKARRAAEDIKARLARGVKCRVCEKPVLRGLDGFNKTCSSECAQIWRVGRYEISAEWRERFKDVRARSILRRDDPGASKRRWAERRLNGLARSWRNPCNGESKLQLAAKRAMELREQE